MKKLFLYFSLLTITLSFGTPSFAKGILDCVQNVPKNTPIPGDGPENAAYDGHSFVNSYTRFNEDISCDGMACWSQRWLTLKSKPAKIDDIRTASLVLFHEWQGGSGIFAKVAAAVNVPCGTIGTNSITLGDRIGGPVDMLKAYPDGTFTVTYLERKEGEDFTQKPSVKITRTFKLTKDWKFVEINKAPWPKLGGPGPVCGDTQKGMMPCPQK